jgi:hypothetical protein
MSKNHKWDAETERALAEMDRKALSGEHGPLAKAFVEARIAIGAKAEKSKES